MKRKEFMKLGAGVFAVPAMTDFRGGPANRITFPSAGPVLGGRLDKLGGMTLEELRRFHDQWLRERYIPHWERGVDRQEGGFADLFRPGEEPVFDEKRMYYQARAVWVFASLYNRFTRDDRHLRAAVAGRDFLRRNALTGDDRWISRMNRSGTPLSEPLDHYGDIYMILALAELYKATGEESDLELAKRTARTVMQRLLSPSYQHVEAHVTALQPGTKRLPSWQHFLSALTPLLRVHREPEIERMALYCVRVLCERHWLADYQVLVELLDDHFRPFTFDGSKWGDGGASHGTVSGWHSIQACWMVMDEAFRVGDRPVWGRGVGMGYATLEKMYLEGRGLTSLRNPGARPDPHGSFAWGALDDLLVFCLMVLEHNHDPRAVRYYDSCFELYNSRPELYRIYDLLHHPRRLFYSIEILDRMIARNGAVSGFLTEAEEG